MEPNPMYLKLMADLEAVKTEIEIKHREKAVIESEIAKYSRRVEEGPKASQDIMDVQRETDQLKAQYAELKTKLSQAQLSESLESKQKGSQFQIIDPAKYPLNPSKPNKIMIVLGGCVASLFAGILFAMVVDVARQRVWTQSEIEALWGVPVLIDIPAILTDADLAAAKKKKVTFALSSAAGMLAYSFCLYGMWLKHSFVLQTLDPLLQRFYK
jgi:hypothetical protein